MRIRYENRRTLVTLSGTMMPKRQRARRGLRSSWRRAHQVSRLDVALGQLHRDAPDLLDGPADQRAGRPTVAVVFLGGSWFA